MKKIMFNDAYRLTDAVLSGRKTQTRRIIPTNILCACDLTDNPPMVEDSNGDWHDLVKASRYKVGEVVAVAQSYKDIACGALWDDLKEAYRVEPTKLAGWTNKMFVRTDLMPHQIRITNVRVERLRDITEVDCLAEGVEKVKECEDLYRIPIFHKSGRITYIHGSSSRAVYAALIDRISGKGTWESNPWVFVYDFEIIK